MGDALFSIDNESRVIFANKEFGMLLDRDVNSLIGKNIVELIPESSGWMFHRYLERTLLEKKFVKHDFFRFANKRFEVYFYPVRNGVAIFLHDITVKWHTEELYRLALFLLDRLNETVFLVRFDGRLFHVNDETCRLLGYSHDELIHMKIFDVDSHITEDGWGDYFNSIKKQKKAVYESMLKAKDGTLVPVDVCSNYIMLYGNEYYCVTARDITDRKRAEEEISRLASIVTSCDDAIIGKTLDGTITSWNEAAELLYGYSEAEAVGKSMEILVPQDRIQELHEIMAEIRRGERVERHETERVTKDGRRIDVSITTSPLFDAYGNVIGASTIARDITERKLADMEIQKAKALVEIYNDLLGHDINNMNQVGIGYLELALAMPGLSEDLKKMLQKPLDALQNSSNLIDNVKKLQRIRYGEVRHKIMDINLVLLDVKKSYSSVQDRDIIIKYSPMPGYTVMADDLLTDVFSNLIGNAIKHSTGTLVVGIGVSRVYENGKEYFRVFVEDNGPGIQDNIKNKLFTRFQRGNTTASGKGLGLYLVKALVEDYGGSILVEDRVPGDHAKGSKFVVMLPAIE